MKVIVALAFAAIIGALATAGLAMLRGGREDTDSDRGRTMWRALAWRVGLSIALFLGILISYKLGWISPTGVPRG